MAHVAVLILMSIALVASLVSGHADAGNHFGGQKLRVAMWGGGWNRGLHEFVGKPFVEQTGAQIEYVIGVPRQHFARLMAAKGQEPPFDVVQIEDSIKDEFIKHDLFEKVDLSKIPNVKHVYQGVLERADYGPTFMLIPIGIVYNTEKFKAHGIPEPKSWDVLWDPRLAGRVAIPDMNVSMAPHTLVAASIRGSGDPRNYTAGIQELAKIKLNHIYSSPVEVESQITNGNVWALAWTEGRANGLRFRGFPVKYVHPATGNKQGTFTLDSVHVVKGTKSKQLAEIYINLLLDPLAQLKFAKAEGWAPATRPAADELKRDEQWRDRFSIKDEADVQAAFRPDWQFINENWNDIVMRWDRALKR